MSKLAGIRAALAGVAAMVVLAAMLAAGVAPAAAQVEPYGSDNYGQYWYIMPPGNNGTTTLTQLPGTELGTEPPNFGNQSAMYEDLLWGQNTLTDSNIGNYFIDGTFGVQPNNVASTVTPEPGATILWSKDYGVPHIYGDTRPETMFASGYAAAQSRLFEMDALRHIGRADVAGFAGGANANQDAYQWAIAPYTEQELNDQITELSNSGPLGHQVYEDGVNYIAGINAYIAKTKTDPLLLPSEYTVLGKLSGPAPFVPADLIAIASAIAGVEGDGGGTQLQWTMLQQDLQGTLGSKAGVNSMLDFHSVTDPAAPTTIDSARFPYDTTPSKIIPGSEAIPDPGSVVSSPEQVKTATSSSGALIRTKTSALTAVTEGEGRFGGLLPTGDSNALLVSAKDSASGHPLAVMGPQLGYFSPELVFEEDIHGPGIDADGVGIPGVSQYVELGHGPDYAWSATSGYEGLTSTFAVPLCDPSGAAASISDNYYEENGQCVAMDVLTRTESWTPNIADSTPAGSQVLTAYRTAYGLVEARATIKGQPVAYVLDRSTYMHELDSAIGFMLFNEPAEMDGPLAFQKAASHIGYAFNWFYTDSKNIAYFNSGLLPVPHPGTNPLYPTWSKYAPVGFNPANNTSKYEPNYVHPQDINSQPFLDSWNNLEAQGYSTNDSLTNFTSVWRVQLLTDGIKSYLSHGKMTLSDLIKVMENAGTIDLRGEAVLPYLLKVIGTPSDPALASAVAQLKQWMNAGSHRISAAQGDTTYIDSGAIQTMDAWWPLLVKAIFEPAIGTAAWNEIDQIDPTDQPPDNQETSPGGGGEEHMGSAWDIGFYGTVQTDLQDVLGMHPPGALSRKYCGNGSLSACRSVLESTLQQAIAEPATQVYPGYSGCKAGDQWCWDAIDMEALGATKQPLMEWVNRPTFQQAVDITSHRPYAPLPACNQQELPTVSVGTVTRGVLQGTAVPRLCGVPNARLTEVTILVRRIGGGLVDRRRTWSARARGTKRWTLRLPKGLKAGRYSVTAHVTDVSGDVASAARTVRVTRSA
jgi:acyl-homoserine lactone acylase PvdQ